MQIPHVHFVRQISVNSEVEKYFPFWKSRAKGIFPLVGVFEEIHDSFRYRNPLTINFNFAFGLYAIVNGVVEVDDEVELKNGDTDKIFNTVANEIDQFMKQNKLHVISFKGSTPARTRKYRQLISKHFEIISAHYEIYGISASGDFIEFIPNSNEDFVSFLIENKIG